MSGAKRISRPDVCIIGLGAAGGVAAHVLTAAGLDVVGLEAGPHWAKEDFSPDEMTMYNRRNTLGAKFNAELQTLRPDEDTPTRPADYSLGKMMNGVGGGSVHWGAWARRFFPTDFLIRSTTVERYGEEALPTDGDVIDWPFTYEELEPYYTKAEYALGISGSAYRVNGEVVDAEHGNALEADRSAPFPMPPLRSFGWGERLKDATRRLGLHPFNVPAGVNSVPYDGRPACTYCGFCSGYGCYNDAKASTLDHDPEGSHDGAARSPTFLPGAAHQHRCLREGDECRLYRRRGDRGAHRSAGLSPLRLHHREHPAAVPLGIGHLSRRSGEQPRAARQVLHDASVRRGDGSLRRGDQSLHRPHTAGGGPRRLQRRFLRPHRSRVHSRWRHRHGEPDPSDRGFGERSAWSAWMGAGLQGVDAPQLEPGDIPARPAGIPGLCLQLHGPRSRRARLKRAGTTSRALHLPPARQRAAHDRLPTGPHGGDSDRDGRQRGVEGPDVDGCRQLSRLWRVPHGERHDELGLRRDRPPPRRSEPVRPRRRDIQLLCRSEPDADDRRDGLAYGRSGPAGIAVALSMTALRAEA